MLRLTRRKDAARQIVGTGSGVRQLRILVGRSEHPLLTVTSAATTHLGTALLISKYSRGDRGTLST